MRHLSVKVALIALGILLPLLGLELAARVIKGKPIMYLVNFVEAKRTLLKSVYPTQYDSDLGWIPRTGVYGTRNYWGKSITILEHGVRYNGPSPSVEHGTVVLAVGDSFTFGDQVNDHETWPAQLEKLSGNRVINGGVFAYGLDQTVLRAEQLVDAFLPNLLVISFIPEDILRTEFSVRSGAPKPFFVLVEGELDRRNSPVPVPAPESTKLGFFRSVFGYSFLMDGLMRKLGYESLWYARGWEDRRVHTDRARISCLLLDRVSELALAADIEVILLAQYLEREVVGPQTSEVKNVLECAAQSSIGIVDMHTHLREIAESNPAELGLLYFEQSHMTAHGNALVARILFDYLIKNHHVMWTSPSISSHN